jgi:hypothetical protein
MVKFSIRADGPRVITKNLDTQQEYITSDETMQRLWPHLFPGTAYFSKSASGKVEGFETVELDAQKAKDFELALTRNPLNGGRRRTRRYKRGGNKKKRTSRRR